MKRTKRTTRKGKTQPPPPASSPSIHVDESRTRDSGRRLLIEAFPEIRDRILLMVREGVPLVLACATARISKATLFNYLNDGEALAERRDAAGEDGTILELTRNEAVILEFVDQVREARSTALRRNVGLISLAARRDWKAAMALLEREYRSHFAQPERIATVTTGEGETKTVIRLSWADGTPDDEPL